MEEARNTSIPNTARAHLEPEQPRSPAERMRKRVLIVEATPSSLRLCRDILQRAGFSIEISHSGIAAITSAREQRPDLIVMDLQLPDVPGRELIGWLRDVPALKTTPVIILAGATGSGTDLAQLGPNTLLRKPYSAMMIHRAILDSLKSN